MQSSGYVSPTGANAVLEKETRETYKVVSYHFAYKGSEFCLNALSSSSGQKYVAVQFPLSYIKLAMVGAAIGLILLAGILAYGYIA